MAALTPDREALDYAAALLQRHADAVPDAGARREHITELTLSRLRSLLASEAPRDAVVIEARAAVDALYAWREEQS
jgi:hypothetical protein